MGFGKKLGKTETGFIRITGPPSFELLHSENWNFGPPSVIPLQHSENWNYEEPPTFVLKHSEAWSS